MGIVLATDLAPGRYVCVQTPGLLAWAIRKATHSPFSHVFITGPGGMIIEATPRGVHFSLLSSYTGRLACANAAERMTTAQGDEVWSAAKAMVGDIYAFPDLLALGALDLGWHWNLVFRLLGSPPWRICSQLAVLAGQAAMPPLDWRGSDAYADEVTPAALSQRPGVVPVVIT